MSVRVALVGARSSTDACTALSSMGAVDWRLLIERMRSYLDDETTALDIWERENWHRALDQRRCSPANNMSLSDRMRLCTARQELLHAEKHGIPVHRVSIEFRPRTRRTWSCHLPSPTSSANVVLSTINSRSRPPRSIVRSEVERVRTLKAKIDQDAVATGQAQVLERRTMDQIPSPWKYMRSIQIIKCAVVIRMASIR